MSVDEIPGRFGFSNTTKAVLDIERNYNQIIIAFHSSSCLGQKTAKRFSVFESSCHLPTCQKHCRHQDGLRRLQPLAKSWLCAFYEVKKILLEISFTEETRTRRGNKDVPQTFFHNSSCSRKYVLIRLTPYHWQICILQFCDMTKGLSWISTGSLGLQIPVAVAKFSKVTHCYQLVIAFLGVREFLKNYAFGDVTKLRIAGLSMVRC